MDYNEALIEIETLVDIVGEYQLEAKKKMDYSVEAKATSIDYVTNIDKQSEDMIITRIGELYPDHSVLGEETGMTDKESDYVWVIDPIDGTTNYVHNFPNHAISIGLKYKGKTVLGVVDLPVLKMRFTAIKGQGAYMNHEQVHVSKSKDLINSIIATGFPYTRRENNMNLPYFLSIVNEVSGIRRTGSAACDLAFVAAGMLDGYWEFALNEWDILAGVLLIEEAGGIVTLAEQDDHELLISGSKEIHDTLLDVILKKSIVL